MRLYKIEASRFYPSDRLPIYYRYKRASKPLIFNNATRHECSHPLLPSDHFASARSSQRKLLDSLVTLRYGVDRKIGDVRSFGSNGLDINDTDKPQDLA